MYGYLLLNGNVVTEAGLGAPTEWSVNHVPVSDMVVEPATLVGKFYSPRDKKTYDVYEPRSGRFNTLIPMTSEDINTQAIVTAENVVQISASNLFVRFINDVIAYGQPLTEQIVRSNAEYVIRQLDKYLGEGNYVIGE